MKRGSRLTSVVLPAPDGPTSATVSPACSSRSMRSSAGAWSRGSAASRRAARCGRLLRPGSKLPPRSGSVASISVTPLSSAARPRVIGPASSDRCLIGGTSCSIATMKATKLPTVLPPWLLCQSAATITAASAHDASTCVIGVIVDGGDDRLHRQPAQHVADALEARRLRRLGAVQADAPPGEHVLLDDVGELVDRVLALHRQRDACAG